MHTFHIRYRNTQGTLMRILNAASRRALDMPLIQAEPSESDHAVTLMLEVNAKQVGQLSRDWYAIVDVVHVQAGISTQTPGELARKGSPYRASAAAMAAGAGTQQALA